MKLRVSKYLTVFIGTHEYDVSAMSGIFVGDLIEINPNALPPVRAKALVSVQPVIRPHSCHAKQSSPAADDLPMSAEHHEPPTSLEVANLHALAVLLEAIARQVRQYVEAFPLRLETLVPAHPAAEKREGQS